MNRSLNRLVLTYVTIAGAIYICESVSFWFYPLAIILISNQYLTIILLGHEGVHGLLHRNRFVNQTIARYFCHFPFLISHSHFSMIHLLHHRNLGTEQDPDIEIYQKNYRSFSDWAHQNFVNMLNLTVPKLFFEYFNGAFGYLQGNYRFKIKTDYKEFFVFWFIIIILIFALKIQISFLLYWLVPLFVLMPWVLLMNSYQHYSETGILKDLAYTMEFKNVLIKELLFPININYHEAHHERPNIPYFKLASYHVKSKNSILFSDFTKRVFSSQKNKTL